MAKATGKKAAAPKAAPPKAAAKKAAAPKVAPKKAAAPKAAPKKAAAPKAAPKKLAALKKAAAPTPPAPKKIAAKVSNSPVDQKLLLLKLFEDGVKDIYWAEKHLTKALPKMIKAATTDQLKQAFQEHLTVTERQIGRVEKVFEAIGKKAVAIKCEAMAGLTREAENIISETQKGTMTRDAALILAAQKVEHYEIATYGGLAQLAETLGLTDAKNLLGETLQEEKDTDELLTKIAVSTINVKAEEEVDTKPEKEEDEKDDEDNEEIKLPSDEEKPEEPTTN